MEGNVFEQLGLNWKLLLSQTVNFFILLIVLRFFVYKPLLAIIKKRNEKIQEGLQKAETADSRLKEVDEIAKNHLKKANQESIEIIKNTQQKAKELAEILQNKAEAHHKALIDQAKLEYQKQQEQTQQLVFLQALDLVKKTIIKTVQLDPKHVDEAMIEKAVTYIKDEI